MGNALSPLTWLPLFERAHSAEIGIGFKVDGMIRESFRNQLYNCKKQSGAPWLDELIIFTPNNDEIWICKKAVELDA